MPGAVKTAIELAVMIFAVFNGFLGGMLPAVLSGNKFYLGLDCSSDWEN